MSRCKHKQGCRKGSQVPASLNLTVPVKTFGAKNVRGIESEAEWVLLEGLGDPGGS